MRVEALQSKCEQFQIGMLVCFCLTGPKRFTLGSVITLHLLEFVIGFSWSLFLQVLLVVILFLLSCKMMAILIMLLFILLIQVCQKESSSSFQTVQVLFRQVTQLTL